MKTNLSPCLPGGAYETLKASFSKLSKSHTSDEHNILSQFFNIKFQITFYDIREAQMSICFIIKQSYSWCGDNRKKNAAS